ncbi:hypothetical protein BKA67DRAFT_665312 [Truncatella angustata]|uniref:Uncharacterized protein n=1 Tax=Truncatella angustata TaxID=152316 RepID=A0A9P8REN1_9PEZI|nr:uncharacterized protein BKA67DRAFT_665312 [Truncatella angustata]KAH6639927.1 hypothetical protein BKA67DRAFT_665312 [Truncatella angustata]
MDITRARSPVFDIGIEGQLPDYRAAPALGRRHATKRQTAEPPKLSVTKSQEVKKAKFSFGKPLENVDRAIQQEPSADWLALTEKNLEQDIETSKKELELIKSILEDIDQWLQIEKQPGRKIRDQKILMGACREYSDSMIQVRKERLRQTKFWLNSRDMGRSVPVEAPAEWRAVDTEWRHWLGEQAAARSSQSPIEDIDDTAWRILGPLPHILAAYTWLETTQ